MKELLKKAKQYKKKVDDLIDMHFVGLIPFSILMRFEEGETLVVGKSRNVVNEKLEYIEWNTVIPPDRNDTSFEKHYHDCIESTEIESGVLTNLINGEVKGAGETMLFGFAEPHYPVNLGSEDVICTVRHYMP